MSLTPSASSTGSPTSSPGPTAPAPSSTTPPTPTLSASSTRRRRHHRPRARRRPRTPTPSRGRRRRPFGPFRYDRLAVHLAGPSSRPTSARRCRLLAGAPKRSRHRRHGADAELEWTPSEAPSPSAFRSAQQQPTRITGRRPKPVRSSPASPRTRSSSARPTGLGLDRAAVAARRRFRLAAAISLASSSRRPSAARRHQPRQRSYLARRPFTGPDQPTSSTFAESGGVLAFTYTLAAGETSSSTPTRAGAPIRLNGAPTATARSLRRVLDGAPCSPASTPSASASTLRRRRRRYRSHGATHG
jgi:hypothetical protein